MTEPLIYRRIRAERIEQTRKWGRQHRSPCEWISILTEEVGEAADEANAIQFADEYEGEFFPDKAAMVAELIQVAAVAVQAIEDLESSGTSKRYAKLERESSGWWRLTVGDSVVRSTNLSNLTNGLAGRIEP
jgi:NTP pyrophosphatase (non-canonical NTP hydrolase)